MACTQVNKTGSAAVNAIPQGVTPEMAACILATRSIIGVAMLRAPYTVSIAAAVYLAMTRDGTPYEKDMAESFRRAVHNSLLEAIDDLTKLRPIASRPLNPSTPLMAELFP